MSALFDHEAEAALIGAALWRSRVVGEVNLSASDFHDPQHATIWAAMLALAAKGSDFDAVELRTQLRAIGADDRASARVHHIEAQTLSAANAESYARIVADRSQRRQLVDAADQLRVAAADGRQTTDAVQALAESLLSKAASRAGLREPVTIGEYGMRYFAQVEQAKRERADGDMGLTTGIPFLDRTLGGFRGGTLNVVAARPGVGKSALALQLAVRSAKQRKRSLVFALEMTGEELYPRALASELREGEERALARLEHDQRFAEAYMQAAAALHGLPIMIDDFTSNTVRAIASTARRSKMKHPDLALIVVDYLQLVQAGHRTGSRAEEVGVVSRTLKALAKETQLPVVALAQLSREHEKDKRAPNLSDLRESGAIEQDADSVVFLHPTDGGKPSGPGARVDLDLIVAKNRRGGKGVSCPAHFFAEWMLFAEAERRQDDAPNDSAPTRRRGRD